MVRWDTLSWKLSCMKSFLKLYWRFLPTFGLSFLKIQPVYRSTDSWPSVIINNICFTYLYIKTFVRVDYSDHKFYKGYSIVSKQIVWAYECESELILQLHLM